MFLKKPDGRVDDHNRADRNRIEASHDEAEKERLRADARGKAERVGKLIDERRKAALESKREEALRRK